MEAPPGAISDTSDIQVGTVIKDKWILVKCLGAGAFGQIFLAQTLPPHPPLEVALKFEKKDTPKKVLHMETTALTKLQGHKHYAQAYYFGYYQDTSYLVQEALGPNLLELVMRMRYHRFSLGTVLLLGIQALEALDSFHTTGFIHRDLKPANFLVGRTPKTFDTLYLIDFGLLKRTTSSNGTVIAQRQNVGFRGTIRYASSNAHYGRDLSRVDDLWSLLYILVEFYTGSLPWCTLEDKDEIRILKDKMQSELIVEQLPSEFKDFVKHLQTCTFYTIPDYKYLQELLRSCFHRLGGTDDMHLDFYDYLKWEYSQRQNPPNKNKNSELSETVNSSEKGNNQSEKQNNESTPKSEDEILPSQSTSKSDPPEIISSSNQPTSSSDASPSQHKLQPLPLYQAKRPSPNVTSPVAPNHQSFSPNRPPWNINTPSVPNSTCPPVFPPVSIPHALLMSGVTKNGTTLDVNEQNPVQQLDVSEFQRRDVCAMGFDQTLAQDESQFPVSPLFNQLNRRNLASTFNLPLLLPRTVEDPSSPMRFHNQFNLPSPLLSHTSSLQKLPTISPMRERSFAPSTSVSPFGTLLPQEKRKSINRPRGNSVGEAESPHVKMDIILSATSKNSPHHSEHSSSGTKLLAGITPRPSTTASHSREGSKKPPTHTQRKQRSSTLLKFSDDSNDERSLALSHLHISSKGSSGGESDSSSSLPDLISEEGLPLDTLKRQKTDHTEKGSSTVQFRMVENDDGYFSFTMDGEAIEEKHDPVLNSPATHNTVAAPVDENANASASSPAMSVAQTNPTNNLTTRSTDMKKHDSHPKNFEQNDPGPFQTGVRNELSSTATPFLSLSLINREDVTKNINSNQSLPYQSELSETRNMSSRGSQADISSVHKATTPNPSAGESSSEGRAKPHPVSQETDCGCTLF
ncbi:putative Tau-tubulin kinase [Blattamonas nauphoetae]|uniref:non-specific serine/threonine protein kinase n=1 Tax=Blattamonas nauphoetae TaxID=2049346 RepID=A0ABQ9XY61_9EUKA|nr:putative Tau-tubulin kinase [Blattamonas nauphoetae]